MKKNRIAAFAFHSLALAAAFIINAIAVRNQIRFVEIFILNIFLITFYLISRKPAALAVKRERRLSKDFEKLKLVYEAEHRNAEILFALNKISLYFTEKKDIDSVLSKMVSEIAIILKADIILLEIFGDEKISSKKLIIGAENLRPDNHMYEKVKGGSSVLINHLCPEHSEFGRYPELYRQEVASFIAAPLKLASMPIGLIGMFSKTPHEFSGAELRQLSVFSTHGSLIVENAILLEETRKLSVTDELTGLYNYRCFIQKIDEEVKRARRYAYSLSIIMCDIDHFKNYNDLNGHEAGNTALKKIAGIFKSSVRDIDLTARYGGEEFVLLLVETSKENAALLAERIRTSVEKEDFMFEGAQPGGLMTVTLGIAGFPDDGNSPEQIISAADKALYAGKKAGRNRVVTA